MKELTKYDKVAIEAIELCLTECVGRGKYDTFTNFVCDLKDCFDINNMNSEILNDLVKDGRCSITSKSFFDIREISSFIKHSGDCNYVYKFNIFLKYKKYNSLENFLIYSLDLDFIDIKEILFEEKIIEIDKDMLQVTKDVISDLNIKAEEKIEERIKYEESEFIRKKNFLNEVKDRFK